MLLGHRGGGDSARWTLRAPDGEVMEFDYKGLLRLHRDQNGVGLMLMWEPGEYDMDWRISQVVDSVSRTIRYEYDGYDRLVRVVEPASGLQATYAYDANGALEYATDYAGRTQRYEYDFDATRAYGDYVPEGFLAAACENMCAPSSSSCDAGGACDVLVADATQACHAACGTCATECKGTCGNACETACRNGFEDEPGCAASCTDACAAGDFDGEIQARCDEAWAMFGESSCSDCRLNCASGEKCKVVTGCVAEISGEAATDAPETPTSRSARRAAKRAT